MPYKDPEKRREYQRRLRENNKDKIKEYQKEYYQNNKEYLKNYKKEYDQTPQGKKIHTISDWKRRGLIHDNYEELYEKYLNTTKCDVCKKDLTTTVKYMDHDHNTGKFRWVLCQSCNTHDNWMKKV